MREELLSRCEAFVKDCATLRETFPMDNIYCYPICSSIYANAGKVIDGNRIKECRGLMRNTVGVFSNFRGNAEFPILAMISLDDDMQGRIERTMKVYESLKDHLRGSEYLSVAAAVLSGIIEPEKYEELSVRAKAQYELMKDKHPFLTSSEDSIFAVLMALSEKSDEVFCFWLVSATQIQKKMRSFLRKNAADFVFLKMKTEK